MCLVVGWSSLLPPHDRSRNKNEVNILTGKGQVSNFCICTHDLLSTVFTKGFSRTRATTTLVFRDFSLSLQQMLGHCLKSRPRPLPSTSFPVHNLLVTPFIRRCIVWVSELKASLNKLQTNDSGAACRLHHVATSAHISLNVVIEWLTLLPPIREVLVSNLFPETGYPDWCFRGFPQSLQENAGTVPNVRPPPLLPHPSQFIIHVSTFHSTLYSSNYLESVVK
jgi:hypothetical protein